MSEYAGREPFASDGGVSWTPDIDGWEATVGGLRCGVYESTYAEGERWNAQVDMDGGDWLRRCDTRAEAVSVAELFARRQEELRLAGRAVDQLTKALQAFRKVLSET